MVGDRGSDVTSARAQRILIAGALFFAKNIIILDEETNVLDKKMRLKY
jgi:ABC-type multidrug transport system fused ATPase/permease subunit